MIASNRWVLKLGVASLALALIGGAASAQQRAPEPKAAPKVETKAPAANAPAKKKAKKAASVCKGLAEAACGGNTACSWVKASKTKAGKDIKAYCRLKPASKKAT